MDRLKQELGKLELPTTGTKNELQRRLREQLQLQGIDIETYEFKDEEEREIQAPAASNSVDFNSLIVAMMEKMEVTKEELFEASRAENQKLLGDVREASRAENQKLLDDVREASKRPELRPRSYSKLLEPKIKNFWLNGEKIMNK